LLCIIKTGECINTKYIPYLDLDKIAEDKKYDGYYVLITSKLDISDHEVAKRGTTSYGKLNTALLQIAKRNFRTYTTNFEN